MTAYLQAGLVKDKVIPMFWMAGDGTNTNIPFTPLNERKS
jgi:hypothetical protein